MSTSQYSELGETIEKLNAVSPSFCLAKWKQVTLHLHNGLTHSCHHPIPHTIPLDELKNNPSALHNTNKKKELRKMMLKGDRPAECHYCWKIEDLNKDLVSDRFLKSNDYWAKPELDAIAKLPWDANVSPSYLEVSFSHACHFKCMYCAPHVSSSWEKEIRQHGPVQLKRGDFNTIEHWDAMGFTPRDEENNPYIDAFWKWLPDIYKDLRVLRVTGGEPLLSKHTPRLLKYVAENPQPNLEISVNSNLGIYPGPMGRFIEDFKAAKASSGGARFYTSMDAWGKTSEYVRTGLNLELYEQNINAIFQAIPDIKLTIMCTFNFLTIFEFQELLEKVSTWKKSNPKAEVNIDISYLWHPKFMSVLLWGGKIAPQLEQSLTYMKSNGFNDYEIDKLNRLIEYSQSEPLQMDVKIERENLKVFLVEMDRRRNLDHKKTFPDLEGVFQSWS